MAARNLMGAASCSVGVGLRWEVVGRLVALAIVVALASVPAWKAATMLGLGDAFGDEPLATLAPGDHTLTLAAGETAEVWLVSAGTVTITVDGATPIAWGACPEDGIERWGACGGLDVEGGASVQVSVTGGEDTLVHLMPPDALAEPWVSQVPWLEIVVSSALALVALLGVWRRIRKLLADA